MYLSVIGIQPLDGYKLLLRFENDEQRVFDVEPFLDRGLFRELKDSALFRSVRISFDTICWSNHLDLDPEFLYQASVPFSAASQD